MRLPRLSIARLMGFVLVAALGLVGLMRPDPLWASLTFTAAVVVLVAAILNAAFGPGRSRPFWVGFAVAGWLYLVVTFGQSPDGTGPPPLIVTHAIARFQAIVHPLPGGNAGTPFSLTQANNVTIGPTFYSPANGVFVPISSTPSAAPVMIATSSTISTSSPAPSAPNTPSNTSAAASSPPSEGVQADVSTDPAAIPAFAPSPVAPVAAPAPAAAVSFQTPYSTFSAGLAMASPVDTAGLYQVGHSLAALLAGLLGGYYALFVARRRDRAARAVVVSPSSP